MQRLSRSLLLVLVLVSSGCSYLTNIRLLSGGELTTGGVVTVPFTYTKDLIVVDAQVNGRPGRFLLDTGAFDSKVERSFADQIGLPTITTKRVTTAQGLEDRLPVTRVPRFNIGTAEFAKTSAGLLNFDDRSATACIAPQGLIGANLMRRGYWRVDYQAQNLTISDQPLAIPDIAVALAFSHPTLSATPRIKLMVDGREVSGVLFDTGFNGGLVLPRSFADTFSGEPTVTLHDRSTSGIFGTNDDTLVVKDLAVELGGQTAILPVEFSSLDKALLGNDVIEHFDVVIDYEKDMVFLTPRSDIEVDPPRRFIPGIGAGDVWVVDRTESGSGMSLGQTIETIGDQRPSEVFSDFCDYFLNLDRLLTTTVIP